MPQPSVPTYCDSVQASGTSRCPAFRQFCCCNRICLAPSRKNHSAGGPGDSPSVSVCSQRPCRAAGRPAGCILPGRDLRSDAVHLCRGRPDGRCKLRRCSHVSDVTQRLPPNGRSVPFRVPAAQTESNTDRHHAIRCGLARVGQSTVSGCCDLSIALDRRCDHRQVVHSHPGKIFRVAHPVSSSKATRIWPFPDVA